MAEEKTVPQLIRDILRASGIEIGPGDAVEYKVMANLVKAVQEYPDFLGWLLRQVDLIEINVIKKKEE